MKVEVLYFDGCPSHERLMPRLRRALVEAGSDADVELRRIESPEHAERERFLGSPSVRIDGADVDPAAAHRTDFGLKCRLYATAEGRQRIPSDEWIRDAIERTQRAPESDADTRRRACG